MRCMCRCIGGACACACACACVMCRVCACAAAAAHLDVVGVGCEGRDLVNKWTTDAGAAPGARAGLRRSCSQAARCPTRARGRSRPRPPASPRDMPALRRPAFLGRAARRRRPIRDALQRDCSSGLNAPETCAPPRPARLRSREPMFKFINNTASQGSANRSFGQQGGVLGAKARSGSIRLGQSAVQDSLLNSPLTYTIHRNTGKQG